MMSAMSDNDTNYLERRLNVKGKVAVIAGGGGGLGRAIAIEFARAGMHLALADRNEMLLTDTVTEARGADVSVISQVIDLRDPEALAAFYASVATEHTAVDVCVNVVGGTFRQSFADTAPKAWDALIRTNYTWLLNSTHHAIPLIRKTGRGGSIINLSSVEGHRAAPGFAVYAGLKGAVENFTRTLAVELGPEGIRVNTIAPDVTPTEGMAGIGGNGGVMDADEVGAANVRISFPMGRLGTYDDIGGSALFLASDLSRYVTGTCLHPDGGTYASSGWFNWPGSGFGNTVPADAVRAVMAKG